MNESKHDKTWLRRKVAKQQPGYGIAEVVLVLLLVGLIAGVAWVLFRQTPEVHAQEPAKVQTTEALCSYADLYPENVSKEVLRACGL